MNILRDVAGMMFFRSQSVKALASRNALISPIIYLAGGFAFFVFVRNDVYAGLREVSPEFEQPGMLDVFLRLNVLQAVLFLALIYVPAVISLSNAIAGDGLGLSVSRAEYRTQLSALFPLWGTLFILAAPLPWVFPQFVVLGPLAVSIGILVLVLIMTVYTVWAVRELNYISTAAALGVFCLSWVTLPLFYLLTSVFFALPLFIMFPLLYVLFQRMRSYYGGRESERSFHRHLQSLAVNPQDSDAQYQLGLIHLQRGNPGTAKAYFEAAIRIDDTVADYHYHLGRALEAQGEWAGALEQYEETYRTNPKFGQGDIFREVGKAYLQNGKIEKAVEFLQFFLNIRASDPEGRYWLAHAFKQSGRLEETRAQLNTILELARTQPRFFRREHRQWIYRTRMMLRR